MFINKEKHNTFDPRDPIEPIDTPARCVQTYTYGHAQRQNILGNVQLTTRSNCVCGGDQLFVDSVTKRYASGCEQALTYIHHATADAC